MKTERSKEPLEITYWLIPALNMLMRGDFAQAIRILNDAPSVEEDKGSKLDRWGAADAVANMLARVSLESGDVAKAARTLPPLRADSRPEIDRNWTDLAPFALRGEIQCANGQAMNGLDILETWIASIAKAVGPNEPGLARVRAVAGLCSLSIGDTMQAKSYATLAKRAFTAKPNVSPWFKAPLAKLERALDKPAARH